VEGEEKAVALRERSASQELRNKQQGELPLPKEISLGNKVGRKMKEKDGEGM